MFQSYKTRVARESFRTQTVRCVGSLSPYTPNLCIVSYSACETSPPPKIYFIFICLCMSQIQGYLWKPEESMGSPRAGSTGCCEPPDSGFGNLYLKEHQALLTSELSFQPLSFFFLRTWLGVCLWRCGHLVLRTPSCPMFCLLAACCFRLVQ